MLLALVGIVCLVITLSWGRQAIWSMRLALNFPPRQALPDLPDSAWPVVTVCVPLRGADPVLGDMLRGLCLQDYPNYEIRIVVDSVDDTAWPIIHEVIDDFPSVKISTTVLTDRLESCSLKVSALLQAFKELDWQTGVVALIDADVVPPPHWLRELVRPFDDPKVAATTGLRWYHTDSRAWGSLVRGLWGAGAAAQMYSLDVLWGGTLAFRASVVRDPSLREVWANSFVEDTSAVKFLRDRQYKLCMVPRLTMINPEATTLPGCFRFLRRQMLCMRLHHPAWLNVFYTTLGMVISPVLALTVAATCFVYDRNWLAWSMLGVLTFGILLAGLPLAYIDGYFWYTAPKDKPLSTLHPKHILVVPMTMIMQLVAVLAASRAREIDWRGIRYSVEPGGRVRRLNDAPYVDASADAAQSIL